jgi:predicted histone-like DNA-binding protein
MVTLKTLKMAIKYKLVSKKNPRDLEAPSKFYASSVTTRRIDIDQLSENIARASTVARSDVYAVLIALIDEMLDELAQGSQVNLGKLGGFYVNLRSNGAETEDAFNSSLIKGAKVIYRPGSEIKTMLGSLKYEKE